MTTLLQGIVGSQAYGLAHEGSDVDRLGVFVAPTLEVAGLDWHSSKESHVQQGPEGDDFAEHEVGKFLKLVLKANPTVSELLWLPEDLYEQRTIEGNTIIDLRSRFLARLPVMNAYQGYARAQMRKYRDGFPKVKYARHCLRMLEQGHQLWRDGFLNIKVENPQRYFDLEDREPDQVLEILESELRIWSESTDVSALPEEPDKQAVRDLLSYIRKNHLE